MSDFGKVVVFDTQGNVMFDSATSGGGGTLPAVRVEYRVNRTKDGNFQTYEDGTKVIGNGKEVKHSRIRNNSFFARYRITALTTALHIKRITVSKNHGLRVKGLKEGQTIPQGEQAVFDVFYGPADTLRVGYNDRAFFKIETKELGVIIDDGIRVVSM